LKSKQNSVEYADKVDRLNYLYYLDNQNFIDLFFGDEAGFSLNLNVPYGWQFPNEEIRVLPQRGKQINVLGFMKSSGDELHTFSREGSVKTGFVIEAINTWRKGLTKPTVLILDNARIHHSIVFKDCLAEWENSGLYIFFLPAYSPHLNRIERLWQKIKQRWLSPGDYMDLNALKLALERIWNEFGEKLQVNFK
jgi:hypothetical protein